MRKFYALMAVLIASHGLVAPAGAGPSAIAPSVSMLGKPVQVSGAGFAGGSLVNIRVIGPRGAIALAAAVANPAGAIEHTLILGEAGAYRIEFLDAGNQRLAETKLMVAK